MEDKYMKQNLKIGDIENGKILSQFFKYVCHSFFD